MKLCIIFFLLFASSMLAQRTNKHISNSTSKLDFDINEAYTQLMYAYSAYCPTSLVASWKCYFCTFNASSHTKGFIVNATYDHPATNTFAFIGFNPTTSTVEVAFRGTQPISLDNWISDLNYAHLTPYSDIPKAYVHSGFMDAYDTVRDAMRAGVQTLVQSTKATRVVFTGHSLGAALATLCAVDMTPLLNVPTVLYNFGSPRVGNLVFSEFFYQVVPNTFRIVNRADIVPHLPTELMGFHHVPQEIWWKTASTYVVCDKSGEDPKCADSVLITNIPDHLDYLQTNLDKGGC